MTNPVNVPAVAHSQVPSRRQIAARKRALAQRAGQAWLAGRANSPTPVADRLIARYIGKGWSEESARKILKEHCLTFNSEYGQYGCASYVHADTAAGLLVQWKFCSQRNAFEDAVALMQEEKIPAQYWQNRQNPYSF